MKIAVIGGRDFNDYSTLSFIVSEHKPSMLISGGAKGADALSSLETSVHLSKFTEPTGMILSHRVRC